MDTPERIWVQWPNVGGCGLAFKTPANPRHKSDDRFNKRTAYILATPEALAVSPEAQALIREAEARVMRIAAGLFPGGYDANFAKIEAAIRGETP